MERSWYEVRLHGGTYYSPLSAERAAELRSNGMALEPASAPDDLAERLAPVYRYLLDVGYHESGILCH